MQSSSVFRVSIRTLTQTDNRTNHGQGSSTNTEHLSHIASDFIHHNLVLGEYPYNFDNFQDFHLTTVKDFILILPAMNFFIEYLKRERLK